MDQETGNHIAICIKEGRLQKGYTQQELSDLTGISIRSVQRIENGEVIPREYTLRLLMVQLELKSIMPEKTYSGAEKPFESVISVPLEPQPGQRDELEIKPGSDIFSIAPRGINKSRKIILSIGVGIVMILGPAAFISQSVRFPETTFETFCLWSIVTAIFTAILYWIWR